MTPHSSLSRTNLHVTAKSEGLQQVIIRDIPWSVRVKHHGVFQIALQEIGLAGPSRQTLSIWKATYPFSNVTWKEPMNWHARIMGSPEWWPAEVPLQSVKRAYSYLAAKNGGSSLQDAACLTLSFGGSPLIGLVVRRALRGFAGLICWADLQPQCCSNSADVSWGQRIAVFFSYWQWWNRNPWPKPSWDFMCEVLPGPRTANYKMPGGP